MEEIESLFFSGSAVSVAAGRISYLFGMRGPSVSIDTACSSSLVSTHLAWLEMEAGNCPSAISCGVKLILSPETSAMFNVAGMLAPDGRCKTLDARADGYVRGEAVGAIAIHALESPPNWALALLRGSAVNQDGRSSTLTAPNGPAQHLVIQQAIQSSGLNVHDVCGIQMHGTGTSLGDPIEVGAATSALIPKLRDPRGPLIFSSGKTVLGHTEPAAGIVGLLQTIIALLETASSKIVHLQAPNPFLMGSLRASAPDICYLPRETGGYPNASMITAISGFAFQGTNANVILEKSKHVADTRVPTENIFVRDHMSVLPPLFVFGDEVLRTCNEIVVDTRLSSKQKSWILDHVVSERVIFPGAGYIEIALVVVRQSLSSLGKCVSLESGLISSPLMLNIDELENVILSSTIDISTGAIRINSSTGSLPHFGCSACNSNKAETTRRCFSADKAHAQSTQPVPTKNLYTEMGKAGLMYGRQFRLLSNIKRGQNVADAVILAEKQHFDGYALHPALLDNTFQLGGVVGSGDRSKTYVPAGFNALCSSSIEMEAQCAAVVENVSSDRTESLVRDFSLSCDGKYVIGEIKGLESKPIGSTQEIKNQRSLQTTDHKFQITWQASSSPSQLKYVEKRSLFPDSMLRFRTLQAFQSLSMEKNFELRLKNQSAVSVSPSSVYSTCDGATCAAMLRTLSQECPWVDVSSHSEDTSHPLSAKGGVHLTARHPQKKSKFDGYGLATQAQVTFEPRLQPCQQTRNNAPYRLEPRPRGSLANLCPQSVNTVALNNTVVIEVRAVGINFRDVLNVLDMYPGDPGSPGGDFSGVVIDPGNSAELCSGQAVFGLAPGCLGSHVHASPLSVVPMPSCITFAEAASTPTIFTTVHVALNHAGRVLRGETILVHAAAGGVGLAAVYLARSIGVNICATAGSSTKRNALRLFDVCTLSNSRDLCYTEDFPVVTKPVGFVLNTLTSPGMVAASLACMRMGGSFVEISKRDVWSTARILSERPDIACTLVAVDFMSQDVLHKALLDVSYLLSIGSVRPIPLIKHNMSSVAVALRQMSQARHIGKVVTVNNPNTVSANSDVGSVVVTGGLGMIGSLVMRWLSLQSVHEIILTSRSGKVTQAVIDQTRGRKDFTFSSISMLMCDISSQEEVFELLNGHMGRKPISAVFHAGGVLSDATLANQTPGTHRTVYAPKVDGLRQILPRAVLHPNESMVLFSSISALLGAPGQINYSAANALLDSCAQDCMQMGLNAISIQWGAWEGAGMAAQGQQTKSRVDKLGMGLLAPKVGIASLEELLACRWTNVGCNTYAVNPFKWKTVLKRLGEVPAFLSEMSEKVSSTPPRAVNGPTKSEHLDRSNLNVEWIEQQIRKAVFAVVGVHVDRDSSLMESGLDSLGSVELRNSLSEMFGTELPATVTFDYPSIAALAVFVKSAVDGVDANEITSPVATPLQNSDASLAIRGISTRHSASTDYAMLMYLLWNNKEIHESGPLDRWEDFKSNIANQGRIPVDSGFGTFVESTHTFDPSALGISAKEAIFMDPQQRVLLEETALAIQSSGYTNKNLYGQSLGVFVGCIWLEYADLLWKHDVKESPHLVTGNGLAFMAGRVSYTFGWSGPCVPTNTACSSSLVACHLGARCIGAGDCSTSVVAGVNAILNPKGSSSSATSAMNRVQALSPDGRCKAFGAEGDGYGRGEGYTVLVLDSAMKNASEDDSVLGILASTSVNQDGRSSGLTAPHGPSQQYLVVEAMRRAGIDGLYHVASHGTGTPLGDPIETSALRQAVARKSHKGDEVFTIGAMKVAIGHTEGEAGLAGLLLSIIQTKENFTHGLRYRNINPYVESSLRNWDIACRIPIQTASSVCEYSGTSSFGMSGVNSHAIVKRKHANNLQKTYAVSWLGYDMRSGIVPVGHALVSTVGLSLTQRAVSFTCNMTKGNVAYLWDHNVAGKPIMPGAGYLEIATACVKALSLQEIGVTTLLTALCDIVFMRALPLPSSPDVLEQLLFSLSVTLSLDDGTISIASFGNHANTMHLKGRTNVVNYLDNRISKTAKKTQSLDIIRARCVVPVDAKQFYNGMSSNGLKYGPKFRRVYSAAGNEVNCASGVLRGERDDYNGYIVHPFIVDGCFQIGSLIPEDGTQERMFLPTGISCYVVKKPLRSTWSQDIATRSEETASVRSILRDHTLIDASGELVSFVRGLEARAADNSFSKKPKNAGNENLLYGVEWMSDCPLKADVCVPERSMVVDWTKNTAITITASMSLFQSFAMQNSKLLSLFTQSVTDKTLCSGNSVSSASLWGLIRTVLQETRAATHGGEHLQTVDSSSVANHRISFLGARNDEISDGYGRALDGKVQNAAKLVPVRNIASTLSYHLTPQPRGALGNLKPVVIDTNPVPGTVLVKVKAVGLNFRDVLNVLGMYPGDPGSPGGDFSGVALDSTPGREVKAGERVFGLGSGSLGSHVRVSPRTIVQMPNNLTYEEAATTPTVFVTVQTALSAIAGCCENETVLIHTAAGGVGLAAAQLSDVMGLKVNTTAGNSRKRALLRSQGVSQALNSRNLSFVEYLALIGGVDVVLNTLTSAGFVSASISALKCGGRFVEISKRDIWSVSRLSEERPDVSYAFVAVDFMREHTLQQDLRRISGMLASGRILPLSCIVHDMKAVSMAMRQMSQARHIGKVVVKSEDLSDTIHIEGDAIVTGGTGMIGSLVANWLAVNSAQHIVLTTRSGNLTCNVSNVLVEGSALFESMATIVKCDVSSRADSRALEYLATGVAQTIMHASGVLYDGIIQNQTLTSIRSVHASKISSAESMKEIFWPSSISCMVLYSSIASLLGSPGQSNYSASNGGLDGMSQDLNVQGCPCISIQWGAWMGEGMAGQDAKTMQSVENSGMGMLRPEQALSQLEALMINKSVELHEARTQASVAIFDWDKFLQRLQPNIPTFFDELSTIAPATQGVVQGVHNNNNLSQLVTLSRIDRKLKVDAIVQRAIQSVVGVEILPDEPLMAAGLDSLGAVEFTNALSQDLGIDLPSTLMFDYPSRNTIVEYLDSQLGNVIGSNSDSYEETGAQLGARVIKCHTNSLVAIAGVASKSPNSAISRLDGDDSICVVPNERWDIEACGAEGVAPRFGGFLRNIELFDPMAFGVSEYEAAYIDSQQRILLELTEESLRTSGPIDNNSCVGIGIASAEYNTWVIRRSNAPVTAYSAIGGAPSVACGRISYSYGYQGPSFSVDTACSSSLVAAHICTTNILDGVSSAGMVGGVGLILSPGPTSMFQKAGMLAPDGRCKTLDQAANGYVRSEACGVIILKSVFPGEQDSVPGCFIKGTSVTQDGRSSSLTAPNGPSQQRTIRHALKFANMDTTNITALQLHGTGTTLGDPIEIGATNAVFFRGQSGRNPLAVEASKSWIGHSEAASGVMGVLHSITGLGHSVTKKLYHLQTASSHVIGSSDSHCWHFPREKGPTTPMLVKETGLATGVSSFAFQGTNAHTVISNPCHSSVSAQEATDIVRWNRRRIWMGPTFYVLLDRCLGNSSNVVEFDINTRSPQTVHLWDTAIGGRLVLSTGVILEVAGCGGKLLSATSCVDVVSISLSSPIHLSMSEPCFLKLQVDIKESVLYITSNTNHEVRVHLSALLRGTHSHEEAHRSNVHDCAFGVLGVFRESDEFFPTHECTAHIQLKNTTEVANYCNVEAALQLVSTSKLNKVDQPLELPSHLAAYRKESDADISSALRCFAAPDQLYKNTRLFNIGVTHDFGNSSCFLNGLKMKPLSYGNFERVIEKDQHILDYNKCDRSATPLEISTLNHLEGAELEGEVERIVQVFVEEIIGEQIEEDEPLMAAGLDSLGATELHETLQRKFGVTLPGTLAFDYPSKRALSTYITSLLQNKEEDLHSQSEVFQARRQGFIIVSDISGGYHLKGAETGDLVIRVPVSRWDVEDKRLGRNRTPPAQFGVFLPCIESFDANILGISKTEAITMDPQQRLLLEVTADVLQSSQGTKFTSGDVGVFVGIGSNDYESLCHQRSVGVGPFSFTAASMAVASGRLAYVFGLKGPSASIDTACSASLVSIHLAAASIMEGSAESAIACGVLLCLVPESTMMCQLGGMLSLEGRSKVLDASADGYVRGEACRAISLHACTEDNLSSCTGTAIINGSSVNTNGRSSSLTAPHGPTQQVLIRNTLRASRLTSAEINGLQMHANGTSIGDPIEVGGAAASYCPKGSSARFFMWCTTKGHTGHQEAAAGVMGITQACTQILHRCVPPAKHLRTLNTYVSSVLERGGFKIPRISMPYLASRRDAVLRLGVSSFGAQGTNAHSIISQNPVDLKCYHSEILPWKRERYWVAPPMNAVLHTSKVLMLRKRCAKIAFETRLNTAQLYSVRQYVNRGHPCISSSLLCSVAASTLHAVVEERISGKNNFFLFHGTVASPEELPIMAGMPGKGTPIVHSSLSIQDGQLLVHISEVKHFTATVAEEKVIGYCEQMQCKNRNKSVRDQRESMEGILGPKRDILLSDNSCAEMESTCESVGDLWTEAVIQCPIGLLGLDGSGQSATCLRSFETFMPRYCSTPVSSTIREDTWVTIEHHGNVVPAGNHDLLILHNDLKSMLTGALLGSRRYDTYMCISLLYSTSHLCFSFCSFSS